jgi:hypothetical protein
MQGVQEGGGGRGLGARRGGPVARLAGGTGRREFAGLPLAADARQDHEHADEGGDDQELHGRERSSPLRRAEVCDHAGEMPVQGL